MDPDTEEVIGFVYIFLSDGSLEQGAGEQRVHYSFNLTAGDYMDNYDFFGMNLFTYCLHQVFLF